MDYRILIIVITAIIAGTIMITAIARSIVGVVKHKSESERASNSPSLTTSELEQMLRDVVSDATAPLHAKIEALEARLDRPLLEATSPKIDLSDREEEETVPVTRTRQRN